MKKLLLKIQTNGFYPCSVLSVSFMKLNEDNSVHSYGESYYFPTENYNTQVVSVNKLSEETITLKRDMSSIKYPKHFEEDKIFLNSLFIDVDTVISYNVDFEMRFISDFMDTSKFSTFSLMKENTDFVAIGHSDLYSFKFPTFLETACMYDIKYEPQKAINFLYSVEKIYEMYNKTLKRINLEESSSYQEVS